MKKRIIGILLALVLCVGLLPAAALGGSHTDTDIAYAVTGGNIYFRPSTGEIVDCDDTVTKAVIPAAINGQAVTAIGSSAFRGCSSLTGVTIPDSVTSIGSDAFEGCSSLTGINIPDSVTSIGVGAFSGCSSLTEVSIPDGVTTIEKYTFCGCNNLIRISIPDSVTYIGYDAFSGCNSLTEITIPDSVTYIEIQAFCYCSSLTEISIPNSVTYIGDYAFCICNSLTDVYYGGTEEDWERISIGSDNTPLTSATIHYESGIPPRAQIQSASLTLEGEIGVNFYTTPNLTLRNDPDAYAEFTVRGRAQDPILLSSVTPDENGRYVFTQRVAAKEMTEQITLRLYAGDGTQAELTTAAGNPVAENAANYSVAKYVRSVTSDEGRALAEKLAGFGAYSMAYFGYDPVNEDTANAAAIEKQDVSGVALNQLKYNKAVLSGSVEGLTVSGVSLTLDAATTINVSFKPAAGHSIDEYSFIVGSKRVVPVLADGKYYVYIPNIAAKDLDADYRITVETEEELLTLTASALSYAYSVLKNYASNESKAALCDMVRALYLYNVAADEYFGA